MARNNRTNNRPTRSFCPSPNHRVPAVLSRKPLQPIDEWREPAFEPIAARNALLQNTFEFFNDVVQIFVFSENDRKTGTNQRGRT